MLPMTAKRRASRHPERSEGSPGCRADLKHPSNQHCAKSGRSFTASRMTCGGTAWRNWPVQTWVAFFLAATLLALPLSSSAKSILIVASLGLIVFSPVYRRDLLAVISQPWCKAALLLFFVAVLASIWGPATLREKMNEIEKYSKLLYLPILAVGFRDAYARHLGLHGFLLAMLITFVVSTLMYAGVYSLNDVEAGGIFRNHIMTGYMMAFAAYLSGLLFYQQRGKMRILYAVLTALFSYHVLFVNNGRTGYVVYLLLLVLLMLQLFSWRQAWVGILLGCTLVVVTFYYSPVMHDAVNHAVSDYHLYKNNEKDTAIGYRLQFHDYAYNLFKRHPWVGNGAASFSHIYHEENPIPTRGTKLMEPHSQYWLVASEFGLLGCFALALFLASLFVSSWRLTSLRPVALAVLLPFLAGNLSDSLLYYSGTGYFFILFMALCFGSESQTSTDATDYV